MQQQQVQDRLAALKKEFETGQARLKKLEAEQVYLRETLLRISGAIQVLEEILREPGQAAPEATMASPHALTDPDGQPAS